MVTTFGSNIVSAFTGGVPVKAIYAYGEKVWPSDSPVVKEWYVTWSPSLSSGQFTMWGSTYDFSSFSDNTFRWRGSTKGFITYAAFNNSPIETVDANVEIVDVTAFGNAVMLSSVSLPECETVAAQAFYYCTALESIYLPNCKVISWGAFDECWNLSYVSLPVCESIGTGGGCFYNCGALESIELPACKWISGAFAYCMNLSYVSLPVCEYVGPWTFEECDTLESIDLPACTYVDSEAFCNMNNISYINLPVCSHVGYHTFDQCQGMNLTISMSMVQSLVSYTFTDCNIEVVNLRSCSIIEAYAFDNCHITSIYLRSTSIVSIEDYNMDGVINIKVPQRLYNSYRDTYPTLRNKFVTIDNSGN